MDEAEEMFCPKLDESPGTILNSLNDHDERVFVPTLHSLDWFPESLHKIYMYIYVYINIKYTCKMQNNKIYSCTDKNKI